MIPFKRKRGARRGMERQAGYCEIKYAYAGNRMCVVSPEEKFSLRLSQRTSVKLQKGRSRLLDCVSGRVKSEKFNENEEKKMIL